MKKKKNRRNFLKSALSLFVFINLFPGMQKIIFEKYNKIKRKKNKDGIWILNSLDD